MQRMFPRGDFLELEDACSTLLIGRRRLFGAGVSDNLLMHGSSDLEEVLRSFARDDCERSKVRGFYHRLTGLQCDRIREIEIPSLLSQELQCRGYVALRLPNLFQSSPTLAQTELQLGSVLASPRNPATGPAATLRAFEGSAVGTGNATGGGPAAPANTVPTDIEDRFTEVLKRVPDHLPKELKTEFMALLEPVPLAIMAATLAVWAIGHSFGAGEAIDAFLLGFGLVMLGTVVFRILDELIDVFKLTISPRGLADLDKAAEELANVIALIGVAAFIALLTKVAAKFRPTPKPPTPKPPRPGTQRIPLNSSWSRPKQVSPTTPAISVLRRAYGLARRRQLKSSQLDEVPFVSKMACAVRWVRAKQICRTYPPKSSGRPQVHHEPSRFATSR